MFDLHKYKFIFAFSALALLSSACGSSAPPKQDQISTAVAQTVQAQNSLTEVVNIPTLTPALPVETAAHADGAATDTPAPVVGAPGCTVAAVLTAESPPDYTLLKPGEYFWKTWSLENTGTCRWDSTYKLIFSSGDLMDGLIAYPLPEPVAPGETKDISIYLRAPAAEGTYTGYWLIQTPWNAYFGINGDNPFYAQIVVTNAKKPGYGITSVAYALSRDPKEGCPVNVRYTVYATITTNGPYEFDYYWDQKDGNHSGVKLMKFTEAGSQTISRMWMVGRGDSPNPRWMQIIVTGPDHQEFDRFVFENNCP